MLQPIWASVGIAIRVVCKPDIRDHPAPFTIFEDPETTVHLGEKPVGCIGYFNRADVFVCPCLQRHPYSPHLPREPPTLAPFLNSSKQCGRFCDQHRPRDESSKCAAGVIRRPIQGVVNSAVDYHKPSNRIAALAWRMCLCPDCPALITESIEISGVWLVEVISALVMRGVKPKHDRGCCHWCLGMGEL